MNPFILKNLSQFFVHNFFLLQKSSIFKSVIEKYHLLQIYNIFYFAKIKTKKNLRDEVNNAHTSAGNPATTA